MNLTMIVTAVLLLSTSTQSSTTYEVFALPSQVTQESRQLEPETEEALKKFSALNSRLDVGLTYHPGISKLRCTCPNGVKNSSRNCLASLRVTAFANDETTTC